MTTQIEQLETLLKDKGFRASAWKGARIYLGGYGRDIKAYFEFDDPEQEVSDTTDLLDGTALKVWSDCAQPRKWLLNRAKQVKHSIMEKLKDSGLTEEVCETWNGVVL